MTRQTRGYLAAAAGAALLGAAVYAGLAGLGLPLLAVALVLAGLMGFSAYTDLAAVVLEEPVVVIPVAPGIIQAFPGMSASDIITMGIGTPSSIPSFLTLGLDSAAAGPSAGAGGRMLRGLVG